MQWIWKQNSGHTGRESGVAYALFVQFLDMGPDRALNPFALQQGLTPSGVYDRARRFNWLERAKAFDAWLEAGQPAEVLPPKEEKRRRTLETIKQAEKKVAVPSAPVEVLQQETALEPEVIGAAMERVEGGDQRTGEMLEYRDVMRIVGKSMGMRAVAIDGIVGVMQNNIERTLRSHERSMEACDFVQASAQMQSVNAMVLSFSKLCDTMSKQAEAARACWGDALGVNQMLRQMYAQMMAEKGSTDRK